MTNTVSEGGVGIDEKTTRRMSDASIEKGEAGVVVEDIDVAAERVYGQCVL